MVPSHRKTTPKVKNGKVQRKNRIDLSHNYNNPPEGQLVIIRQRPGEGYRHLLMKRDIEQFVKILPDWKELSTGLKAILLAPGEWDYLGWHWRGFVAICAWERELVVRWHNDFWEKHREILDKLGVQYERDSSNTKIGYFTESSARGFQLMHVLLHELGHHHDRMTTRSQLTASRGENYAEQYALRYSDEILERYFKIFGW